MYYLLAVAIAFVLAILGDLYDIALTVKGIKLGVAVEGNEDIVKIAGNKPSYMQLLAINMFLPPIPPNFSTWPIIPIGVAGFIYGSTPVGGIPFATILCVIGLKHFLAGRKWLFYINGGKDDLTHGKSAWQKFIEG